MTDQIPAEAVEAGARALFEESQELGQDNSWDDALPDDWREAWRYQAREVIAAALPFLRPEPSEDEREALEVRIADTLAYYECRRTNPKADHPRMGYHAFSEDQRAYLRAGHAEASAEVVRIIFEVTRRPMPSREQVARVIYDCDDLERAVLADAERIADAVLALFEKGVEG